MKFARLVRSANATGLTMPVLPVPFNEVAADTGGFTSSADLTRFTIPPEMTHVALSAGVRLVDNAEAGDIHLSILKNGAAIPNLFQHGRNNATGTTNRWRDCHVPIIDVVAGDYFEVRIDYAGSTAATQINAAIQTMFEIIDRTGFQGCLADRATDLTDVSWPLLPIPFNRALLDTGGWFNAATGEITIPVGVSLVEAWAGFRTPDNAVNGSLHATIYRNGALLSDLQRPHIRQNTIGFADNTTWVFAPRIPVAPGDVITARGNKTGLGSTETVLSDARTIFGCRVLAPLPSASPGRWRTACKIDASAAASSVTASGDLTLRTRVLASEISRSGSRIRLRLPRGTLRVGACYIGRRSGEYGFSDPQQVFFDGLPGFVNVNTAAIVSDPFAFDLDAADDLIVSFYLSGATTTPAAASMSGYSWTKARDDAAAQAPTGYTALTVRRPIDAILVYA